MNKFDVLVFMAGASFAINIMTMCMVVAILERVKEMKK